MPFFMLKKISHQIIKIPLHQQINLRNHTNLIYNKVMLIILNHLKIPHIFQLLALKHIQFQNSLNIIIPLQSNQQ